MRHSFSELELFEQNKEADRIGIQRTKAALRRIKRARQRLEERELEFERFMVRLLLHENGVVTPGDDDYDDEVVSWLSSTALC